jgi:mannitol-1-phosphate 5-dehydrogenase
MEALHFGAGNIGKGLIGCLLNKTGYEVVFVDVDPAAIDRFNKQGRYLVETLDDARTVQAVSPVSALNSLTQEEEVIEKITTADLITTSVGPANLGRIAGVLSKGLLKRVNANKNKLDIIANENSMYASSSLKEEIKKYLTPEEMNDLLNAVSFPNSAIDRLALPKETDQEEAALVEPFYEWVINKKEMINHELPPVKGAVYVDNLEPFIERKLYLVNMGHAATAYAAYLFEKPTIQSALEQREIEKFLQETLNEAAQYFINKGKINEEDLTDYTNRIVNRFKNKHISDDIFRVGRAPVRKLGPEERLVKPTVELFKLGMPVKYMTTAIAAGFLFNNPEDDESVTIQKYIQQHGARKAITHFTGITDERLLTLIETAYNRLKIKKNSAQILID